MNVDHSSGGQGECRQQPGRQGQATQVGNPARGVWSCKAAVYLHNT